MRQHERSHSGSNQSATVCSKPKLQGNAMGCSIHGRRGVEIASASDFVEVRNQVSRCTGWLGNERQVVQGGQVTHKKGSGCAHFRWLLLTSRVCICPILGGWWSTWVAGGQQKCWRAVLRLVWLTWSNSLLGCRCCSGCGDAAGVCMVVSQTRWLLIMRAPPALSRRRPWTAGFVARRPPQ